MPDDDFRIEFTELGELVPNSEATLASILARVPTRSDIFLFSHGWRNDPRTAEDRYQNFINGMARRFPQNQLSSDAFRPCRPLSAGPHLQPLVAYLKVIHPR